MAAADQELHASAVCSRSYQDESYLHGFLGTVGDLQKAGALQDVVLEVEGGRFPCHRLVLSAASPYFRAMFTSDMAESRQKTVVLQGLDAGMFGEILSYIYSGTLHVSLYNVQPLYQAADLLQLDYVRDTCSSYMVENLKVESSNCVDLYKFAGVFSVDVVLKRCLQWIYHNFAEVASSEEFCRMSVNQLTEIISHDELDVKEETTVWEAVVRWVQHSREDRLHHLPSILPYIRFNLLTSDDTAAILEHSLVREDPGSSEVIRNVVEKGNSKQSPRLAMTTEMALLHADKKSEILFMNPRVGKYIKCSYGPERLRSITTRGPLVVTNDNSIYMLDSELKDENQLFMFKYNHAENVWEHAGVSSVSRLLAPLEDRCCSGYNEHLVEVDQILYYLGVDLRRGRAFVQMKKYNRQTDMWQECSQLHFNEAEYYSAALSCGLHLYLLTNLEIHHYDPCQDRWCKRTPPLLKINEICTAVAMGTEIFCTDYEFTQTMVYDTVSDSWQELQGWPDPENLEVVIGDPPSLFVLENQLHILLEVYDNFKQGPSTDYVFYVYDRTADAWRDLKATLPDNARGPSGFMCPVARMYLPYLCAQSTDL